MNTEDFKALKVGDEVEHKISKPGGGKLVGKVTKVFDGGTHIVIDWDDEDMKWLAKKLAEFHNEPVDEILKYDVVEDAKDLERTTTTPTQN